MGLEDTPPPPPPGVTLRSPTDYRGLRQDIEQGVLDEFKTVWPMSYGGTTVSMHDLHYDGPETYTPAEYKNKIMENGSLNRRLRGTIRLTDDATGKVLDERQQTLMKVPYLSDHGAFLNNGSSYTVSNQSRILPGIYTRRQQNGGLQATINTRLGSGPQFKVSFDPESTLYYLEKKGQRIRLYSVLRDMGVDDRTLASHWGDAILQKNRDKYDSRAFDKAFKIFVRKPDPEWKREQQVEALKGALENLQVTKRTVMRTLPSLLDREKSASLDLPGEGQDMLLGALEKMAKTFMRAHGACVFLWLGKGYYLLEENADGTLRPPGGHMDAEDDHLKETILREIEEEFRLKPSDVKPFLRFLGYQKAGEFKDSACFLLFKHGLKPGVYQATNDPQEKIRLVKATLQDPRYIGPDLSTDLYLSDDYTFHHDQLDADDDNE